MTKQEMVVSALQALGLKPQFDKDGDVMVRYQMKTMFVMGFDCNEDDYLAVVYPQLYEVDEGEETKTLAACNKVTREMKLAKVFIDQSLNNVSASCEFYYINEECLQANLSKSLEILSMVRYAFTKTLRSFN